MTKIEMAKAAGEIVVSIGVGTIVGNAIKSTTPIDMGPIKKVCVSIGAMILANLASDSTTEYLEKKIDDVVDKVKDAVSDKPKEE